MITNLIDYWILTHKPCALLKENSLHIYQAFSKLTAIHQWRNLISTLFFTLLFIWTSNSCYHSQLISAVANKANNTRSFNWHACTVRALWFPRSKKSRVESWNWPVKTESIVKHQIDRNLTEILFLGARGTFIWGEHSEGVTNAWDHQNIIS